MNMRGRVAHAPAPRTTLRLLKCRHLRLNLPEGTPMEPEHRGGRYFFIQGMDLNKKKGKRLDFQLHGGHRADLICLCWPASQDE